MLPSLGENDLREILQGAVKLPNGGIISIGIYFQVIHVNKLSP
jgi:hypothetical protein